MHPFWLIGFPATLGAAVGKDGLARLALDRALGNRRQCMGRRKSMATSMRVARLHQPGQPLQIDTVEIPEPRSRDVLIQVKASGVIPNMNAIFSGRLWNHLPPLPASVGLDAAGVVVKVGSEVTDVAVGDRVYVNP